MATAASLTQVGLHWTQAWLPVTQQWCVQFVELLKRDYTQYWRNVPYNGTRFAFSGVIGAIMGCILWSIGDRRCVRSWLLNLLRHASAC